MYFKLIAAEKTTKPAVKSVDQLFQFSMIKSGNFVNLKGAISWESPLHGAEEMPRFPANVVTFKTA